MFQRCAMVVVLLLVGCGTAPNVGTSAPDASGGTTEHDAGSVCSPPAPCYPTCPENSGTCARGHLDVIACVCRDNDGNTVPWPDGQTNNDATLTSVTFDPAPATTLKVQREIELHVQATFSDDSTRDITSNASFEVSPEGALEVLGAGHFRALVKGELTIKASFTEGEITRETEASITVTADPTEARALWVTRFSYSTKAEVQRIINAAADAHFNIILFQVRGVGDAFYKSSYEPWSAQLGALGKDPGWDPLQTAIDTAHARGIELHAYMNMFTGWSSANAPPDTTPPHILKTHPEWVEQDSAGTKVVENMQWLAPGITAVRDYNTSIVRDVLTRYDVDGIHLDRIRYSGSGMGYNALEQQEFQAQYGGDTSKFTQFRTEAVNAQVRALYDLIAQVKPNAKLSAAVWGIHTKLPGCHTSEGTSYYFQDSWAWAEGGYIDALAPMIYWANGTGCTDYSTLLATFMAHKGSKQIWAGAHVNQCESCGFDWNGLLDRITTARNQKAEGITLFASVYLDSGNAWPLLSNGPFVDVAQVP